MNYPNRRGGWLLGVGHFSARHFAARPPSTHCGGAVHFYGRAGTTFWGRWFIFSIPANTRLALGLADLSIAAWRHRMEPFDGGFGARFLADHYVVFLSPKNLHPRHRDDGNEGIKQHNKCVIPSGA